MKSILLFCTIGMLSFSVDAALTWTWSIDNPINLARQDESISITATIYNDPTSTVDLEGLDGNIEDPGPITFPGTSVIGAYHSVADEYYAEWGPLGDNTFQSQFEGVVISPGESFSFDLYTLFPGIPPGVFSPDPVFIPASMGVHTSEHNVLFIQGFDQNPSVVFQDAGSVEITVVPLPASLFLFFSGIMGIRIAAKYRSNK